MQGFSNSLKERFTNQWLQSQSGRGGKISNLINKWVRSNRKLLNICFIVVQCDLHSFYSNCIFVELVNFNYISVSISVSLLFSECERGRAVKERDCNE